MAWVPSEAKMKRPIITMGLTSREKFILLTRYDQMLNRRRTNPAAPNRPVPKRISVPGSGIGVP